MIGKEFNITTLGVSPKKCPNFQPVSVKEIIDRYKEGLEMHLFIEQPHVDENGKRVCNIYDCIRPKYLQHQAFTCMAIDSSKNIRKIVDEVYKDKVKFKSIISKNHVRHDSKILSCLSWEVEIMVHALGMVRVFQYFHPSSGEVCEVQYPLKDLYGKELTPEQYDILLLLDKNNVIKDDHALTYADRQLAKLKRAYDEFVEDINSISR